ncbi:hypothetical protein, partial [Escherichia coli]|uniref:hypothetical protein n=1 Tax=Escherichia coli TaxID=562 RepID=UPI003B81EC06
SPLLLNSGSKNIFVVYVSFYEFTAGCTLPIVNFILKYHMHRLSYKASIIFVILVINVAIVNYF